MQALWVHFQTFCQCIKHYVPHFLSWRKKILKLHCVDTIHWKFKTLMLGKLVFVLNDPTMAFVHYEPTSLSMSFIHQSLSSATSSNEIKIVESVQVSNKNMFIFLFNCQQSYAMMILLVDFMFSTNKRVSVCCLFVQHGEGRKFCKEATRP